MSHTSLVRSVAFLFLAVTGAAAFADDGYVVAATSGRFSVPPQSATDLLPRFADRDDGTVSVTPPFPVSWFGRSYTSLAVSTNGFVQFGGGASASPYYGAFPQGGGEDGICAVAWGDLSASASTAQIATWTEGKAPARTFIVSWNVEDASTGGALAMQVQFQEATGRVVFAYPNTWSGSVGALAQGIDAVTSSASGDDGRWSTADGGSSGTFYGQPANDLVFDPRVTQYAGRVLFDRSLVDGTGIGNAVAKDVPLAGLRVELRDAAGAVSGIGVTGADGGFTVNGLALLAGRTGSLAVVAESLGCAVRPSAGAAPYATTLADAVSFDDAADIGTVKLVSAGDGNGAVRQPLHIAHTIQQVHTYAAARTNDTIGSLDVVWSASSSAATGYAAADGASPASMTVSAAAANPDGWDACVIQREYARHVLAQIAGAPAAQAASSWDGVLDAENAFAGAFGYYLSATVAAEAGSLPTTFHDGLSATASAAVDLESPDLEAAKGPGVTAWIAAALYDLVDAANEDWDRVDGTTASARERPFKVADSLDRAPTSTAFFEAWGPLGGGVSIARDFIHHGAVADDGDEPNDSSAEATVLGGIGMSRGPRVLNATDEDWYRFLVTEPADAVTVQVALPAAAAGTPITLEIQTTDGQVLATGAPAGAGEVVRAVSGPLAPGAYLARLRHDGDEAVPSYSVQVFTPMVATPPALGAWTLGRMFDDTPDVRGGIPPYTLFVEPWVVLPPGLTIDASKSRISGTPAVTGRHLFQVGVRDSASPPNTATVIEELVVNPAFDLRLGEFLAFPQGRSAARPVPVSGGTPPFMAGVTSGELPQGVTFSPLTFAFDGQAGTLGAGTFTLTARDISGAMDSGETTCVVCPPIGAIDLPAGASQAGAWFDAVQGSTVNVSIATAPKLARRTLRPVILGTDGTTPVAAKVKTKAGKATAAFVAPRSGRYYLVVASESGPATTLVATARIAPSRKGGGSTGTFVQGSTEELAIGALEGAVLSFSAKPGRGFGISVNLVDPSGEPVAADLVTKKNGTVSFTRTLDQAGTWSVVVSGASGESSTVKYTWSMTQPKGGAYSAD